MKIISRVSCTEKTVENFLSAPFKWGVNDCMNLAYRHLRNMGIKVKKTGYSKYTTLIGAKRALRELGYNDTSDALDAVLDRIPNMSVEVGDLVGLEGEQGMTAITVYVGNGRVLGFAEGVEECVVMQPTTPVKNTWRVECHM